MPAWKMNRQSQEALAAATNGRDPGANAPDVSTVKPNRLHLVHRWIDTYYGITAADVLNGGLPGKSRADGGALASEAFRRMRAMQTTAIDIERGRVDYARLRGSDAYAEYRDFTRLLGGFDPATLGSNEERLAFWLKL